MTTHIQRCWLCDTTENIVGTCARCQKAYCQKDISRIDPIYCDECMRDVVIEETIITKVEGEWHEDTNTVTYDKFQSKLIKFRGIDWMFASKHIADLTDEELKPTLEYHRAFVYHLESEIVSRAINKRQQQVLPAGTKRIATVKQTTSITRKRVAKIIDFDALVDMAMKLGLTDMKDIQAFLAKQTTLTDKVQ